MDDREIARGAADFQARGRDYPFINIPGYMEWSRRKLEAGESEALIDHLDAMSMFILPEELNEISEEVFDELLEDVRSEVEKRSHS